MKSTWILLFFCSAAFAGCGGDLQDLTPLRLLHSPPIGRLTTAQLRALSMECEKYSPKNSMRGRYDAAYCEEAIAAWGDSPLQIVVIDGGRSNSAPVVPATR